MLPNTASSGIDGHESGQQQLVRALVTVYSVMECLVLLSILTFASICAAQLDTLSSLPSCAVRTLLKVPSWKYESTDPVDRDPVYRPFLLNATSASNAYARTRTSSQASAAAYPKHARRPTSKVRWHHYLLSTC